MTYSCDAIKRMGAIAVSWLVLGGQAHALCSGFEKAKFYESISDVPANVALDLRARASGLVDRGDPRFSRSDIGSYRSRRFLAGAELDGKIYLSYEKGGRGYSVHTAIYDLHHGLLDAPLVGHTVSFSDDVCLALQDALVKPGMTEANW